MAPAAGAPGANIANPQPGVPLGETKITAPIEEFKLNGDGLAGLYHKFTGRRVIVVTAAAAAEFRFIQDASPSDPLTYDIAAQLLRKAAVVEGFVFVPSDDMPNVDILTNAAAGTRPGTIGLGVYNESDPLPEGDAVISYVMTLNYLKPADALNAFQTVVGAFGSYGTIAAIPNASAVIITENTSLIRRLIELKKEIDKPGSVQGTRFIKVQFADVTEIADTLTTLLTAQQAAQSTASGIRAPQGNPNAPQGNVAQMPGDGGGEQTPPQIVPDPRTNRIFAMGRPVDLVFIEGLIREFDIETSEKNFLRRKLRFLKVSEFLPIANDALTRAFTGTGGGTGGGAGGSAAAGGAGGQGAQGGGGRQQQAGGSNRQSTAGSSRSSTSGSSSSSSGSSGFGGGSGGSSSGGGGIGDALGDPDISSAPESVLVGRTLLVADNITNSVVVQGPPSGLEIIERLLDQIDVKPDQIMISTIIGQLSLNNSKEFGVSYLLNGTDFSLGAGGSSGSGTILPLLPTAINRSPQFDPSSLTGSGLRALGTTGDLSIYLKALQSKTDFTVLSRPSIFTSNNQKGTISSGERIAIPTSNNNYNGGGSSTNIEYQDVVLKLEVIPLVNSDNEITMKIALLNDEQNGVQILEGAGSGGTGNLTVPKISTREILTTATVPNGQTIVLGGLIVGKNNQEKSGIPILSDIPLLGKLFSTTTNNNDRSELLVFIQPSIVNNDRSLAAVQADMDSRYKVSENAHNSTDGAGVLPPLQVVEPLPEKGSSRKTPPPAGFREPAPGARNEVREPAASSSKSKIGPPHRR